MTRTVVVGIGHECRGDDVVGLLVARRLAAQSESGLRVIEHGGDGMDLLFAWEGAERVVLVDAVVSGAEPGLVHRIDASKTVLPSALFSSTSTHALGLGEAIELGRTLGSLPAEVVVYGIEGACFDTGSTPSGAVLRSVEEVVARIREEIDDA